MKNDIDNHIESKGEFVKMDMDANKARFIGICRTYIHRDGIDELLNALEKNDFYAAPASTRFHLSEPGGLLQHSLNVYDELCRLVKAYGFENEISEESIAIVSLFHDFCKINLYKPDVRNVKVDGKWMSVPCYTTDERFHFGGHGSKSVYIVGCFMKLTYEEAVAINCHMGSWDGNTSVGDSFEQYPLAWLVHVADEAASFLLEGKRTNAVVKEKS